VELPDDVGADLAGGGQDPKEIPTRRWSERVSEANRILPKHRGGASVSAAWPAALYLLAILIAGSAPVASLVIYLGAIVSYFIAIVVDRLTAPAGRWKTFT
jgi:hypothetical protein